MSSRSGWLAVLLAVAIPISLSACRSDPEPARPFQAGPWIERGSEITGASFAALSGQLKASLAQGGVPAAIEYCSLAAYPLTDSLSEAHSVTIRRSALRFRNPANAPDSLERAVLQTYRTLVEAGQAPRPSAMPVRNGQVAFFAPILLQEPCLACHGTVGTDISESDYQLIRDRYPADSATGFSVGELRGLWSVRFPASG
jgi:hypothetical protein